MKDWPFGIALRWEVPNRLMLLVGESRLVVSDEVKGAA